MRSLNRWAFRVAASRASGRHDGAERFTGSDAAVFAASRILLMLMCLRAAGGV